MKVIMKYLKPFAGTILVSLLILFGQAIGELSLPNLMSEIVNTGIQNGGVEQEAPEALPAEGFALMTLFMDEEDKETFQESYELIEGGSAEVLVFRVDGGQAQIAVGHAAAGIGLPGGESSKISPRALRLRRSGPRLPPVPCSGLPSAGTGAGPG